MHHRMAADGSLRPSIANDINKLPTLASEWNKGGVYKIGSEEYMLLKVSPTTTPVEPNNNKS